MAKNTYQLVRDEAKKHRASIETQRIQGELLIAIHLPLGDYWNDCGSRKLCGTDWKVLLDRMQKGVTVPA